MCGRLHVWSATGVFGYMCGRLQVRSATCGRLHVGWGGVGKGLAQNFQLPISFPLTRQECLFDKIMAIYI